MSVGELTREIGNINKSLQDSIAWDYPMNSKNPYHFRHDKHPYLSSLEKHRIDKAIKP